jgi:hypothetical protein
MTAGLSREEKVQRKRLFGKFSEGFRSLRPYRWKSLGLNLLEIPVTTMPLLKLPIHLSYVLYLGSYSPTLAMSYFKFSIGLCRLFGVEPSILLHPLDFLGVEDDADLGFFPAMNMPASTKLAIAADVIDYLHRRYEITPMIEQAQRLNGRLEARSS